MLSSRLRKLLLAVLAIGAIGVTVLAVYFSPIVTTDNVGADKVVLLHGLGRSELVMLPLELRLTEAGYDVHNFSYPTDDLPPEELVPILAEKINACCRESDEVVHFVGHSLGGLMTRAYLAEQRPRRLGRVVLLGSPNKGSELADGYDQASLNKLLEIAGPSAQALKTGPDGFPASLPPPDYSVGVIAGTADSVVTNRWLPVPNDGLVSVESARLSGMADFITVELQHWQLRHDREVADLVITFLASGQFEK